MLLAHQPQPGFVNQSGGLQGVIAMFAVQIAIRDFAQFRVDDVHGRVQSRAVALLPLHEQLCDVALGTVGQDFSLAENRPPFRAGTAH